VREDGNGSLKAKSQINITPLVDVVLVLLIIFMVIMPILQRGFDGKLPPKRPGGGPEGSIVLEISSDGTLRVNRQPVTRGDLGEKLHAIFSARPDQPLFVAADDGVHYGEVIQVLDACRMPGGISDIAFILE